MKIGFVVNRPETEKAGYTTTHLALAARRRGHDTWHIGVGDLALAADDWITAKAVKPADNIDSDKAFVAALKSTPVSEILVDELDVLFLRNDAAEDADTRPWACLAGVNFGRFAKAAGVTVLNDPEGLAHASNKLYLQTFPNTVRPPAIISRQMDDILSFVHSHDGPSVIKPLTGSGGHDVFVIAPNDTKNVHQMIEAVTEDGFALVQAYVRGASKGDLRLLMVDGEVLFANGHPALIKRHGSGGDLRHNLTAGGSVEPAELSEPLQYLAEEIGPQLRADGIFFAGIDIVGDKILEINVFSPGALVNASRLYGVSFEDEVIQELELKRTAPRLRIA